MRKIKSNTGSTLIIALVIVIIISMIATITTILIGASSNASLKNYQKEEYQLILENKMYDYLNKIKYDNNYLNSGIYQLDDNMNVSNTNLVYQIEIVKETDNYSFTLKNLTKNITLYSTVSFDSEFYYTVLKWGYR